MLKHLQIRKQENMYGKNRRKKLEREECLLLTRLSRTTETHQTPKPYKRKQEITNKPYTPVSYTD